MNSNPAGCGCGCGKMGSILDTIGGFLDQISDVECTTACLFETTAAKKDACLAACNGVNPQAPGYVPPPQDNTNMWLIGGACLVGGVLLVKALD